MQKFPGFRRRRVALEPRLDVDTVVCVAVGLQSRGQEEEGWRGREGGGREGGGA